MLFYYARPYRIFHNGFLRSRPPASITSSRQYTLYLRINTHLINCFPCLSTVIFLYLIAGVFLLSAVYLGPHLIAERSEPQTLSRPSYALLPLFP
jgi:hypothetical protein